MTRGLNSFSPSLRYKNTHMPQRGLFNYCKKFTLERPEGSSSSAKFVIMSARFREFRPSTSKQTSRLPSRPCSPSPQGKVKRRASTTLKLSPLNPTLFALRFASFIAVAGPTKCRKSALWCGSGRSGGGVVGGVAGGVVGGVGGA